jgi:hypothetical protein
VTVVMVQRLVLQHTMVEEQVEALMQGAAEDLGVELGSSRGSSPLVPPLSLSASFQTSSRPPTRDTASSARPLADTGGLTPRAAAGMQVREGQDTHPHFHHSATVPACGTATPLLSAT